MVLRVTGCTSCSKNLQNSSTMPAKLQWYSETEYSENKKKAIDILHLTVLRLLFLENWIWTKIKSDNETSHAASFKVDGLWDTGWNVPSGKTSLNVPLLTRQLATIKIQPLPLSDKSIVKNSRIITQCAWWINSKAKIFKIFMDPVANTLLCLLLCYKFMETNMRKICYFWKLLTCAQKRRNFKVFRSVFNKPSKKLAKI